MAASLFHRAQRWVRREIGRDPFLLAVKRWFRDKGDQTLRLDYPLSAQSLVLDVGGYQGDFASALHEKFACRVMIFEPHPQFFAHCAERFKGNPAIEVFPFGLSNADATMPMTEADDATSFVNQKLPRSTQIQCELRSVADVFKELEIDHVDLMKVNIEGGEYPLLDALISTGLMKRVEHLQVQFHDFIDNAVVMRDRLRQVLSRTHVEMWNYTFVWESWSQKPMQPQPKPEHVA